VQTQGESWLELLTTINNFAYFPRLYDTTDGTYHCDLRRYYKAVNAHLDAANGLLQGIQRFEALKPEPAAFLTIAQMLADFFADMGKPVEAAEMYRKMLEQVHKNRNRNLISINLLRCDDVLNQYPRTSDTLMHISPMTSSIRASQCDFVSRACASHWPNCSAAAGTKENVTSCCSMKPVSAWT
jgi:hypothetical protein